MRKRISDLFEGSFGPKSKHFWEKKQNKEKNNENDVSLQPRLIFFFGPETMGIRTIFDVIRERIQNKFWDAILYYGGSYIDPISDLAEAIERAGNEESPVLIFLKNLDILSRGSQDLENWEHIIRHVVYASSQEAKSNVTLIWWCTSPDLKELPNDIIAQLKNASDTIIISEPDDEPVYAHWMKEILKDDTFKKLRRIDTSKLIQQVKGMGYEDIKDIFIDLARESSVKFTDVTMEEIEPHLIRKEKIPWEAFNDAAVKLGAPPRPRPPPTRKWDELIGLDAAKITFHHMFEKVKQGKGAKFNTMLLWGTPGCGKTEFGQIAVDISGFQPVWITGSEFIKEYVGHTERGVNNFFNLIESKAKHSPVIVFIDEAEKTMVSIDEKAPGVHDFDINLVQTFKSRLGGVQSLQNVIFIASMNLPITMDNAMKRRFMYKIFVTPPNKEGFEKLWKDYLQKAAAENDLKVSLEKQDYKKLAELTAGKYLTSSINGEGGLITDIIDCCEGKVITYDLCESVLRNNNPAENQQTIRKFERHRDDIPDKIPITTKPALERFIKQHGKELGITATVEEILHLEEKEPSGRVYKDIVNMEYEKINIFLLCEQLLIGGWRGEKQPVLLLWGPPGTGKTTLLQATKNVFSTKLGKKISVHLLEGGEDVTADVMEYEFQKAANSAPSILVIDEAEAILPKFTYNPQRKDTVIRYRTLVQGLEQHESRFLIVLITNKPEELDDSVVNRVFSRIYVPIPPIEVLSQIWKRFLTEICSNLDISQIDTAYLASQSEGVAPRQIQDICVKLRIRCDAIQKKYVTMSDLNFYLETIPRERDLERYEQLRKVFVDDPIIDRKSYRDVISSNPKLTEILGCDDREPTLELTSFYQPSASGPLLPGFEWFFIKSSPYAEISGKDLPRFGVKRPMKKIVGTIQMLLDEDTIYTFKEEFEFFVKPLLPRGVILLPETFIHNHRELLKKDRARIKLIFPDAEVETNE